MKRFNVVGLVLALVLMFGLTQAVRADVGNQVNLPGLNFSTDSHDQGDGRTWFSTNLTTRDQIKWSSMSFSKDANDPTRGWINMSFDGTVGAPVTQKTWQGSSMHINYRGLKLDTNNSLNGYQDIIDWIEYPSQNNPGIPIYGDWNSTGYINVMVNDVTLVSANAYYNEYTYDPNGGGGKGFAGGLADASAMITTFNAWSQFEIQFNSPTVANMFFAMEPMTVTSPESTTGVPEPASLSILGVSAVALLVRRRNRR